MRVGKADGDTWFRLSEAADALGVSLNTLRRWSDSGKLACYRSPGGHRRYRRAELETLLQRQSTSGGAPKAPDGQHYADHGSSLGDARLAGAQTALDTLAQAAAEGVGVTACVLAAVDGDGLLRVVASRAAMGYSVPSPGEALRRESTPVADEVQHTHRRVVVADLRATNLLTPTEVASCRAHGEAAVLALPLAIAGRLFGVLVLTEHRAPRAFTGANITFAEFIARQAAGIIATAVAGDEAPARDQTPLPEPLSQDSPGASAAAPSANGVHGVATAGRDVPERPVVTGSPPAFARDVRPSVLAFRRLLRELSPSATCTVHLLSGEVLRRLVTTDDAAEPAPCGADDEALVAALRTSEPRVIHPDSGAALVAALRVEGRAVGVVELAGVPADELERLSMHLGPAFELLAASISSHTTAGALRRRVHDLETVAQAGVEDAAHLSTDEVLQSVIQRLSEVTRSPVADVYAVEGGTLRALISFDGGRVDPEWEGVVIPLARYPCSLRAVETGEVAIATSLDDPILGENGRFSLERWGYQSQLSLPLIAGDRVIGLVELSDYVPRDFADDLELITGLGRVAAQALENARLFELVERRTRILNELVEIGTFASTCRDSQTVLRHVAERLLRTLDAANCDIYQTSDEGLRCVASFDRSGFDDEALGRLLDVAKYPTLARAVTTGQVLVVSGPDDPQLSEPERELYREYGFNSEVCVPLLVNEALFGLIDIYDTRPRQYSEYLPFLRSLGMSLAGAFASSLLFEQLEHRASVLREIVELGAIAAQGGELEELLATIAGRLRTTIGVADCDVFELLGDQLRCLASVDERGPDLEALGSVVEVSTYPVIDLAIRTREPMVVATIDDPRVTDDERADYAEWGFQSLTSIPLVFGEEVLGVLDVFDTRARDYAEYLDFLRTVGQIIAGAIHNARLLSELTARNRELAELVELGRAQQVPGETMPRVHALARGISEVVDAAGCQIFARRHDGFRCLVTWEDGSFRDDGEGSLLDLERFPASRRAIEERRIVALESSELAAADVGEPPRDDEAAWRCDLLVPLVAKERLVGLLRVYDRIPRDPRDQVDFLQSAGQIVATALENDQLVERLERANEQLAHLVEAGLEFGSTLEPDVVLRSAARRLLAAASGTACDIYAIEGDALRCLTSVDLQGSDASFVGTVYPLEHLGAVRDAIADGRPLTVRDMLTDQRVSAFERNENLRYGHRAKVELPLVAGGVIVGLASVFDDRPRDFGDLELLRGIAQVAANAIANAGLFDAVERSAERVALVGDVSFELSSSLDLDEVLHNTAYRLCALAGVPCCDIYTLGPGEQLTCVVSLVDGVTDGGWQGRTFSLDRWSALRTAVERRMPIVIASPDDPLLNDEERGLMREHGETAEVVFPLISKDTVIGVLELLETKGPRRFGQDEIDTIGAICRVAAMAISNARLYADIKRMHLGNLKALSSALNAKDYYTLGHAARVAAYIVLLGEELGWEPGLLRSVEEAAYLHDIGKIGVADRVLLKQGTLNAREWELMRRHPVYSADIIHPLFSDELTAGVRHHHERYDGTGYPDGLAGDRIPLIARAMCVVDAYDAMSFRRPYRQALSYAACREELARCAGTQFDPDMVAAFERVLMRLHEGKREAEAVAGMAAGRLDAAAHATLRGPEDEGSEAYRRVVQTLRAVRDEHPPTRSVTTFVRRGQSTMLVADAEEDERHRSHIGDQTFSDEEIACLFTGEPVDRTVLFVDQSGVWLSGAAPIRDERGEVVAVVNADLPASTGATQIDGLRSDVTQTFAAMVADAAATLGHLELEATTDALTGLYNHRYLHERLDEEIERCVLDGGRLALLLIDLDDFRVYNDRHGHSMGDRALRTIARAIESSLRQVDLAARYGGEEFAVILIDADETGALEVAERIRNGIVHTELGEGRDHLSVSIGLALCPADARVKEELLDKADWAMVLAKRRGRDQVVAFGVEHGTLGPERAAALPVGRAPALARVAEARDALGRRRRAAVTDLALAVARELGLEDEATRSIVATTSACLESAPGGSNATGTAERVALLAAAYEELVTRPPYHPRVSEADALEELRSSALFTEDPRIAGAFEVVLARPQT